jgi:hypothetical protein
VDDDDGLVVSVVIVWVVVFGGRGVASKGERTAAAGVEGDGDGASNTIVVALPCGIPIPEGTG